jgi:hypothetical protein
MRVGILALILKELSFSTMRLNDFIAVFFFLSIFSIFTSVVFSLITIFSVLNGYYKQANIRIGQNKGDPNSDFDNADILIKVAIACFLFGFIIGFIILFFKLLRL